MSDSDQGDGPEQDVPAGTSPEGTSPEAASPEVASPEGASPEAASPELARPEPGGPDEGGPDEGGPSDGDHEDPEVGWKGRVVFSDHWGGRFAYRPEQLVTMSDRADEVREICWERWSRRLTPITIDRLGPCARLTGIPDPLLAIADLRLRGILARPNHVLFTHCDCCGPHPASGYLGGFGFNPAGINPAGINPAGINPAGINPAGINPAGINPAGINPAGINPAGINPAGINPAGINPNHPARVTGLRRSSARPAAPTKDEATVLGTKICTKPVAGAPTVHVLDTGLAGPDEERHCPPKVLSHATTVEAIKAAVGAAVDEPDNDQNKHLDPAAGHGTFIAGIINQVAPGCRVMLHRVATMYGDCDEFAAAEIINRLKVNKHTILSLSFGGHAMDDEAIALGWAIRNFQSKGGVVVASAGNDSTCLPAFPAAFPGVVSVGAIGPGGPAPFTNYGPWVRACAPGVDITSMFFNGFKGKGGVGPDGEDPDNFSGWARWSGTSFSAPVVVGALARMMVWARCNAAQAVKRVIDPPELMRIPNLGTVVNVI